MNITGIWDNGGETIDRFTVCTDEPATRYPDDGIVMALAVGLEPRGFSQWTDCHPGDHLGEPITLADLPGNVRDHIKRRIAE